MNEQRNQTYYGRTFYAWRACKRLARIDATDAEMRAMFRCMDLALWLEEVFASPENRRDAQARMPVPADELDAVTDDFHRQLALASAALDLMLAIRGCFVGQAREKAKRRMAA